MNRILKYLLVGESFWLLAAGLFGPIYAIFVTNVGGDILAAGGAYAAFSFAAAGMTFFISRWEDCVKHKEKLILLSHVLGSAAILGYLLVENPFQLALIQILLGLANAIGGPAFDGLYSKHLDKGRYSSEWGLYDSVDYLAAGISAAAGGFVASVYGFQMLFIMMFIFSLVSVAVSLKLFHLKRTQPNSEP